MLRTKKDVDRHVQDIFKKLLNENERTLRCFKIAELYYNVYEYESARRYLSRYIEVRKEAKAHKLMGQILEAMGQKENALIQYKYSYELDVKQEDLVLKVCELMADPDVGIDINRGRYWVERADKLFPRNKVVFKLKEKIFLIERPTNNEEDLENLIIAELSARQSDVQLRVKLLKHYMDKNKFDKAYKHATDIEATNIHRDSILWYQVLCELFLKCKNSKQSNWSFWITYISSLERYAALSLKEQGSAVKKTSEAIQAIYNFDQHLFEAKAQSFSSYPSLTESIFVHMWGQLHFHMACLLLQDSKHEQSSWSEAGRLCAPLLLTAMHVKPIDLTASWATHLDNSMKNQLQIWYREGSYRCSQAGHVLYDYCRGNQKKLISNIEKLCTGSWRERLYQRIFVGKMYQKIRTSYFSNNNAWNPSLRLVSQNELKRYDEVAEEVWPYSLHHQIWPAIKTQNSGISHSSKHEGPLPNLTSHLFPDLQFSVYNLSQASPVTLCRLDIDAFLNIAALCASAVVEDQQRNNLLNPDRLPTLPADLTSPLCSVEQEKWWSAAYKMYCKDNMDDIGDTRQNLQRGLEVVRCIGNHGLHPVVLVHLARIFHHRAKLLKEKSSESSDISALETRSELYWSAAVPLLERLQNNQTIHSASHVKLFSYIGKDMNNMELTHAIEEGKLLLAQKLVRDKLYEQAIDALQALKCPEASFEQGKIYKRLADETLENLSKESITSEMKSQHVIILSKARNCFYLTLDRLRSPDADPNHPLNAELCTHISTVENELKRIDPDTLYTDPNRNDCDDISEDSYSSAHSDEATVATNSLPTYNNIVTPMLTPIRNIRRTPKQSSTPRQHNHNLLDVSRNRSEARPSPERLDAQIRHLVHSIESLKEQNREQHRAMISKLDELIKISARKENQKPRSQAPVGTYNLEEDLFNVYTEEDYRDYCTYANTSLPPTAGNRTTAIPQNLFAASAQRHPYSPLLYPTAAAALQGYYQGGPLGFPDAAAQHLSGLYPSTGVYPMSSLYRPTLDQSIPTMQQMSDLVQHGLFAQRLSGQVSDYPQQLGQQQVGQIQVNDPGKTDPKLAYTPTAEPSAVESTLKEAISTTIPATIRKQPPVNVVITTSDTLPTTVPSVQPTLSVTIPAQHRLGVSGVVTPGQPQDQNSVVPHSYQISMPSQPTIPTTVNLPPLSTTITISSPATKTQVTENINSSIVSTGSRHSSTDLTEVEHDPIPDFAPIIPLPDEVPVTTGEEDEETLFCARAKLFRFVNKEWKERGIGNIKLLKNKEGKVRLLMRREQVLKICANHMLRRDMELSQMPNNDKAYIWVANDFADEELKLEKLCIKFKTTEEATNFKEHFDKAKDSLPQENEKLINTKNLSNIKTNTNPIKQDQIENKPIEKIGGFSFTSSPIIQQLQTPDAMQKKSDETSKPSPFASFSFVKSSESSKEVSTPTSGFSFGSPAAIQSAPTFGDDVSKITLRRPHASAVTETVKENELSRPAPGEIVIFEQNIYLMQYINDTKLWKDSGSGILKVLLEKSTGKIRLLINKEDNTKTIYNQILLSSTIFNIKNDMVTWTVGIEKNKIESYMARFTNSDQANLFHKAVASQLQKSSKTSSKLTNSASVKGASLSELFKPTAGSWECNQCYLRNDATAVTCVSCSASNPNTVVQKPTQQFVSKNLFEQFKTPTGSWECKDCYLQNDANSTSCVACQSPAPSDNKLAITTTPVSSKPLSEMFKPSTGSWECQECYVVNTQSNQYCVSCDIPRDPSMPPKPKPSGGFLINSETSNTKTKFSFGIPQATQPASTKESAGFNFNLVSKPSEKAVSSPISIFGSNKNATPNNSGFLFGTQPQNTPPNSSGPFTFGSPGKSFDFQLHAKSPPIKSPERPETSDEEYVEEAEDVYFAPVIPLPDKVDVKTGEENEDVLYSHRAKLFKFDTNSKEWKERGLGDIKLLKHKDTKKLRLVMRRNQVLKLCLNHAVTSALEITPKDDKTWLWSAGDYSEGEIEYIQFACRFKTPDIAEEFKRAVDDACKALDSSDGSTLKPISTNKSVKVTTSTDSTSKSVHKKDSSLDIEVVYEVKVSPEEKAAALKLQLPENFYSYKYKESCPGCRGCKDIDEPLDYSADTKQQSVIKSTGSTFVKPNDATPTTQPVLIRSNLFGKTTTANNTTAQQPNAGLKMSFGTAPTVFGDGNAAKPTSFVFGNQSASKPESAESDLENLKICSSTIKTQTTSTLLSTVPITTSATTNIFSGFGSSATSVKPVFGSGSLFSNTAPTQNIFGSSKPLFGDSKPAATGNIFGEAKLPTSNLFGGTSTLSSTPTITTSGSLFGTSTTTTTGSSLFGTPTTTTTTSSLFATSTPTTGMSLFGSNTTTTPGSLFGSNATVTTGSFGTGTTTTTTSLFGSTTPSVFGSSSNTGSSIFGVSANSTLFGGQASATPTFGSLATQGNTQGATFGTGGFSSATTVPALNAKPTIPTTIADKKSLFSGDGSNQFSPSLGNNTTGLTKTLFGNSQNSNVFSNKPANDSSKTDDGINFLPTNNSLSFSDIAAQTSPDQQPAFSADPNFTFDGAGSSVFGSKTSKNTDDKSASKSTPNVKKDKDKNEDDEEGDEENENGDDHDPYFEPIIPLPDAIEVRTGEEEEEIMFAQRAKLYRYDQNTKEWKERGTGEMKVLYHAGNGSYRLLLRREQVYKVVCNMLLKSDLEFRELNTSDRSWVWAGMNYADNSSPEVEQLAVKFKTPDLAAQFKVAVDKAQSALAERKQVLESGYEKDVYEDDCDNDYAEGYQWNYEEEDEDEEEEEDVEDDPNMNMFENKATLYAQIEGELNWKHLDAGNLKVLYDSELFGARIVIENDQKEIVSETVISVDTTMQRIDKECSWVAIDYALHPPSRRTLRAVFPSSQASQEMYETFQDGLECARKADIEE